MGKPIVLFVELKIATKEKYICDIVEKLYSNNISVAIYAESINSISKLDKMLWTWKPESFIPHQIFENSIPTEDSVILTNNSNELPAMKSLVLFDPLPISALNNFTMIVDFAEVYHSDKKVESRKRFKEIRETDSFDLHFTQLGALLSKESIKL